MEKTLVFIDNAFLLKLSKHFSNEVGIKFNVIKLARNLAIQQSLFCEHIFLYTAPPFQAKMPSCKEDKLKRNYDKFIQKMQKLDGITTQEGRCQRLIDNGKAIYKQKGVDTLITMDLAGFKLDYPHINKIILIVCDSDFVPILHKLKSKNIEVILYTYFDRKRDSKFSTSNNLLKSASKYIQLTKKDFENVQLTK